MKIQVTTNNDEDLFSDLAKVEDFEKIFTNEVSKIIKEHPMEFAKEMKDSGAIDDEQYKQMLINIRKANAAEDFK